MATGRDIAARAGVSTATVSHVINQTTYVSPMLRDRVIKAIRELDYHPNHAARMLKTKKSMTVGMIIPDITNPFFPALVRGAEDVLLQENYTLILGNSDGDPRKEEIYYRTFQAKRTDGMLLIVSASSSRPEYLRRHNSDVSPIVYVDRFYPRLRADVVIADNLGGSYDAVRHLVASGHRRVGIITGPLELVNARMRLEGYKRALSDHHVPIEEGLIRVGRFDVQSGYEKTRELLEMAEPPTAVFVSNALMTVGCLRALGESGTRCPQDLALVTFDDLDWFALSHPSVTAVAQPTYELGAKAAELLVKRMSGKLCGPPRRKVLATKLVIRDSSVSTEKTS